MKENERTPSYAVHLHLIVAVIYTLSYENGERERESIIPAFTLTQATKYSNTE